MAAVIEGGPRLRRRRGQDSVDVLRPAEPGQRSGGGGRKELRAQGKCDHLQLLFIKYYFCYLINNIYYYLIDRESRTLCSRKMWAAQIIIYYYLINIIFII